MGCFSRKGLNKNFWELSRSAVINREESVQFVEFYVVIYCWCLAGNILPDSTFMTIWDMFYIATMLTIREVIMSYFNLIINYFQIHQIEISLFMVFFLFLITTFAILTIWTVCCFGKNSIHLQNIKYLKIYGLF